MGIMIWMNKSVEDIIERAAETRYAELLAEIFDRVVALIFRGEHPGLSQGAGPTGPVEYPRQHRIALDGLEHLAGQAA